MLKDFSFRVINIEWFDGDQMPDWSKATEVFQGTLEALVHTYPLNNLFDDLAAFDDGDLHSRHQIQAWDESESEWVDVDEDPRAMVIVPIYDDGTDEEMPLLLEVNLDFEESQQCW